MTVDAKTGIPSGLKKAEATESNLWKLVVKDGSISKPSATVDGNGRVTVSGSNGNEICAEIIRDGKVYRFGKVERNFTVPEFNKTKDNYLGDNSMYNHIATYKINVSDNENIINTDKMIVNLKVNNPMNARIVVVKNDGLVFVDTKYNAEYVRFELDGSMEFMVVEEEIYNINNPEFVKIVSYSTLGLFTGIVVLSASIVLINNRKNRKNIIK